ncbi:Hpt domain-containing protein [Pseudoxanthomonas wuyuanensis]|uniref:Hpt domain-containing protein n=2 Tax=Pseudoxanthomonas wuyuanensis TaxID=1073196 RepID=A0A286CVG6_9GAMM|nr:response regulator [Pseudoxanthomonas wuyuanensis]SOD50408.1 Hpt domain-containing protein [Pseudoxanthomonas wuyuanensis]
MSDKHAMKPRLLLVEDDPISSRFLSTVLQALPADVDIAGDCAAALASAGGHALWLIDANLPDGSGSELLARLRQRSPATPGIAHTADGSAALHQQLLDAGFAQVLVKPLTAQALQTAVRDALTGAAGATSKTAPAAAADAMADWDDEAALRALHGNAQHVEQLRGLFLAELPSVCEKIADALRSDDVAGLQAALHRLRASCGFVGAARLAAAVQQLQAAPASPQARTEFQAAAGALAAAG